MRKLIILALIAIVVVMAATFPAGLATRLIDLPPQLGDVKGTLWNGEAIWRQPRQVPLRIHWRWQPPARWQWQATGGQTALAGNLRPGTGDPVLKTITGRIETGRLDLGYWLPGTRALGRLEVEIERLRLSDGAASGIVGRILWEDAELVGSVNAGLGRIDVVFAAGDDRIAFFESLEPADVHVTGHLKHANDHYQLDAWLEAAEDRPDLREPLERLGTVDADGRVHIRYRGPLGW